MYVMVNVNNGYIMNSNRSHF